MATNETPNTGNTQPQSQVEQNIVYSRACQQCNRKKTKCDRVRPVCGLCHRTGIECEFPLKRKTTVQSSRPRKRPSPAVNESLERLLEILETRALSRSVFDQTSPAVAGFFAHGGPSEANLDQVEFGVSPSPSVPTSTIGTTQESISSDGQQHGYVECTAAELSSRSLPSQSPGSGNDSIFLQGEGAVTEPPSGRIPCPLALVLVDIFFEHIQCWLPIFHKPRFMRKYAPILSRDDVLSGLPPEEGLLLSSMFSLAACHCNHESLSRKPALERGREFSEMANIYYARGREIDDPTLVFLQGCVLLAFYHSCSGTSTQGWILIGVCARLAYDLGLSSVDDEHSETAQGKSWSEKEEMRRAWWLVWELDVFGSSTFCHPFMIDARRMSVLLPVSDELWFDDKETSSAELQIQPGCCWKSLQGAQNQSERAWFLVANFLLSSAHSASQQKRHISLEKQTMLENDLSCLRLALPNSMALGSDVVDFGPNSTHARNWVIGAHLMLSATSHILSRTNMKRESSASFAMKHHTNDGISLPTRNIAYWNAKILSQWSPEDVADSHPFFAFLLIFPHPTITTSIAGDEDTLSSCRELTMLLQRQISRRWRCGSIALRVNEICQDPQMTLLPADRALVKRYPAFIPGSVHSVQTPAESRAYKENSRMLPSGELQSRHRTQFEGFQVDQENQDCAEADLSQLIELDFPQVGENFDTRLFLGQGLHLEDDPFTTLLV
ncbi:hypothetical protein BU24DRAFT_453456 [Aaosphaeria arxii CBS 175.79]|uniref:Zn(2)-C6 fungal-type domain-containing protein n=1 Tax=Aaosphaeria arxii CBS 175.79 TaxID=1450172 RepID=A0A6A5XI27_9PLEO|nr:uncharacterized protein BU24DRAFT_453456 [Aaosphaeria arxii CBS 175.79]KAF2011974.1 hypothetical protein BU24DRAFT_453456 [Aaosphaeria arxii CBS 175.79]